MNDMRLQMVCCCGGPVLVAYLKRPQLPQKVDTLVPLCFAAANCPIGLHFPLVSLYQIANGNGGGHKALVYHLSTLMIPRKRRKGEAPSFSSFMVVDKQSPPPSLGLFVDIITTDFYLHFSHSRALIFSLYFCPFLSSSSLDLCA